MIFSYLLTDYLRWHYSQAFGELTRLWQNFLWFVVHFFSLPQLFQSWFSPWKRVVEERRGVQVEALLSYIIINLFSRLIGGVIRGTVILAGVVAYSATLLCGAVVFAFWIAAPIVIVGGFGFGAALLITTLLI